MDESLFDGFKVLSAVARGIDAPEAIASHLSLSTEEALSHIERLAAAGFLEHRSGSVSLTERTTEFLAAIVERSDLVAIAKPLIVEAEQRLSMRIALEIVDSEHPSEVTGGAPYVRVQGADGRTLVAPVLDLTGQIACVLRLTVEGIAPEAVEVMGKELVVTADSITAALPQRKNRGPDWQLRF